jgi:hypothetical protein
VQDPIAGVGSAVGAKHETCEIGAVRHRYGYALGIHREHGEQVLPAANAGKHQFVLMGFEPDHGNRHRQSGEQHGPGGRHQHCPDNALRH